MGNRAFYAFHTHRIGRMKEIRKNKCLHENLDNVLVNDGAWNFVEYKAKYAVVAEILLKIEKINLHNIRLQMILKRKNEVKQNETEIKRIVFWKSLAQNWFVLVFCFFFNQINGKIAEGHKVHWQSIEVFWKEPPPFRSSPNAKVSGICEDCHGKTNENNCTYLFFHRAVSVVVAYRLLILKPNPR